MGLMDHIARWAANYANRRSVRKMTRAMFTDSEFDWPISPPKDWPSLVAQYKGWVYACATRNAQAVSQVPLRLYVITKRNDPKPKVMTREADQLVIHNLTTSRGPYIRNMVQHAIHVDEVLEHPFLELMATANPTMDGVEVLHMLQLYQELIGNAFLYKIKDALNTVREIWPLMSHKISIVPSKTSFVSHYEYGDGPNPVTLKPAEIAHFRFPNPKSMYIGMSPLEAAATSVVMQDHMDTYEDGLFKNNARPDQVLIPNLPIPVDASKRLEAEFNRRVKGPSRAGRTIAMPFGVDLKQLSFSPKELSFLMGRKTTRDDVSCIYDIPSTLLAPDQGNRGKDEAAEYMHAKYGIMPRCKRMEQRLNQDVVSEYDGRLFCAFDNPVPEDKEFRLKQRTADLRSAKCTINEVREDEGLEPVPWGDEPLIPQNMVPLSVAIANQTAKNTPKDGNQAPLDKTKPGRQKSPDGADKKE